MTVAVASAFVTLLPRRWLDQPCFLATTSAMTVGLLGALVALNAVASGQHLALDARLVALAVAALALWRRVPFLGVVVLGAAGAALGRLAGLP